MEKSFVENEKKIIRLEKMVRDLIIENESLIKNNATLLCENIKLKRTITFFDREINELNYISNGMTKKSFVVVKSRVLKQ